MPDPACAARCGLVATLVLELARATGAPEQVVRLGHGLPGEDREPPHPTATTRCTACGRPHSGPGAASAARRCADLDTGTTD